MITGRTRLVGLIGNPVSHSLSPRMQNAAFAARGLDWAYVPLPVERDALEDALNGLAALGFAGANVTAPYKLDVAALDFVATDVSSVNTLLVVEGRIEATSTDTAILDHLEPSRRPAVLGDGGSATAFVNAFELRGVEVRRFARRSSWPPDVSDADLVVNATSARDEVLVELRDGQTLIDLPYPESATAAAAREAGAGVVGGLEVLVAQGAVSFEVWTGLPAPVGVMRAALGLAS